MIPAEESFGFQDEKIRGIVLDSRKPMEGCLFVPLLGEHSDGHDYIEMAIRNGACAVLSSRPVEEFRRAFPGVDFYEVPDTRRALQEIGLMERRRFQGTVVGVTGSVGKTTTRSMIAAALGAGDAPVFQTEGNANSQVGVPITLFRMARSGARLAVVELGMSEPGEMHRIAEAACVNIAVMTNIGIAHIEQLKTQENILREKLHILDGMPEGGLLLLNGDDPILGKVTEEQIHSYGIAQDRRIRVEYYHRQDFPMTLSVPGDHMLENASAAMHVSLELGVDRQRAAAALCSFTGLAGRGEILRTEGDVTIIDDAYNASPASMKAGLEILSKTPGKRRIAVLADMLELGENSEAYHREVGEYLAALPVDMLYTYGERAGAIARGALEKRSLPVRSFDTLEALSSCLRETREPGDVYLLKGSNSMGLSKIVKEFRTEKSSCTHM